MEDKLTYILIDIHPSYNQINTTTSILKGHDTIAYLPTSHGKSPIFNVSRGVIGSTKDCKQRKDNQHNQS